MRTWRVQVGWTSQRPVLPEQHTSWVAVAAETGVEASLVAAQVVASRGAMLRGLHMRPGVAMVTSTRVL